MKLDQLVFGYDHGHRQMAASRELASESTSLLLGLTDAPVDDTRSRLITGIPLPADHVYALAATWAAPERGRVGAVWAHVLLIAPDVLGDIESISPLRDAFRRPAADNLATFGSQIEIADHVREAIRADSGLVARILVTAASAGPGVIVDHDLEAAEEALLRVWELQWHTLRASFAFRTRDTIRASADSTFVTVARRVRGIARHEFSDSGASEVAKRLDAEASEDEPRLRGFLHAFGPEQPTAVASMVRLIEIDDLVSGERVPETAHALERLYPSAPEGIGLKTELFGKREPKWWHPAEPALVLAVLSARRNAWDPHRLRLSSRLERLIEDGAAHDLASARRKNGPGPIRQCLLIALVAKASPQDVVAVAEADSSLAIDLLGSRDDLVSDPRTWQAMSQEQVLDLIDALGSPPSGIVAALGAGQQEILVTSLPLSSIIEPVVEQNNLDLLAQLRSHASADAAAAVAAKRPDLAIAMAAAGWPGVQDEALRMLETQRSKASELWLHSGIRLLISADAKQRPVVLQTVFGPLHQAVASHRLPAALERELESVLPPDPSPDLALRLRRLLLDAARADKWSATDLKKALRGAGPNVGDLRHALDEDDPLRAVVKGVLKSLRRITG